MTKLAHNVKRIVRKIGVRARFPASPLPLWEIGL
jgi:hypothetical protein